MTTMVTNKNGIEFDIDSIATDLNNKADIDLINTNPSSSFASALNTAGIRTIIETYQNGTSWYRVYSDGWCEQGGLRSAGATGSAETITLLKQYKDTNYIALKTFSIADASVAYYPFVCIFNKTVSSFQTSNTSGIQNWSWYTCGYVN